MARIRTSDMYAGSSSIGTVVLLSSVGHVATSDVAHIVDAPILARVGAVPTIPVPADLHVDRGPLWNCGRGRKKELE